MQAQVLPSEGPWLDAGNANRLHLLGRLRAGVTPNQARANLDLIFQTAIRKVPLANSAKARMWLSQSLVVEPGSHGESDLRRRLSKPLGILMYFVGLVQLIAAGNFANLLLARATSRGKELAVRLSLGAKAYHVARHLFTESAILAIAGGAVGLVIASISTRFLLSFIPFIRPPFAELVTVDVHVLFFTIALSLTTGLLAGLAPVLRVVIGDPMCRLKEIRLGRSRAVSFAQKQLVVIQVGGSFLLLVLAVLLNRSLQNLTIIDLGFNPENVALIRVEPQGSNFKSVSLATAYSQLLARIGALPGVRAASLSGFTPISPWDLIGKVRAPSSVPSDGQEIDVYLNSIYPHHFATLGIPFLGGHDIETSDMAPSAGSVGIINETFARVLFGQENPIGQLVHYAGLGSRLPPFRIVGVVRDAKYRDVREGPLPVAYLPFLQSPTGRGQMTLSVRTNGNDPTLLRAIRDAVQAIDPVSPLPEMATMSSQINSSLEEERLIALVSGIFAVLAVLLACMGLYGILSYSIAGRTNEIGLRMALGASRPDVIRMVLKEELTMVQVGVMTGLVLSVGAARIVASRLFGISAFDPWAYLVAFGVLSVMAVIAGYVPSRRAAQVDPLSALRHE